MEVADASPHNSCLEARGLRHRPCRHKAAIAPAHDANFLSIHQPLLNQVIYAEKDILQVLAAHIPYHSIGKNHAASHTAAHIGSQHGKTSCC